jgi:hypothetical protein
MAKVLNTRLQLRYDTYENWTAKNSPLLEGEIAVVAIPTGKSEMQVTGSQPPQILFKVGPGNFNSLPWASAKAADVHDWAKAANLIVEAAAGQTGNVVSGISWDATNKKITYTTASVATSVASTGASVATSVASTGASVASTSAKMSSVVSTGSVVSGFSLPPQAANERSITRAIRRAKSFFILIYLQKIFFGC